MTINPNNQHRPAIRDAAPQTDLGKASVFPTRPTPSQDYPAAIPTTAEIETALKIALFKARSALHLVPRRDCAASADKT